MDTSTDKRRRIVFKSDLEREWGIRANACSLWRWERDGKFPRSFQFGNRKAWFADVIDAHVNSLGSGGDAAHTVGDERATGEAA
jgi:hypothetical protein